MSLTPQEVTVINHLSNAFNAFYELPDNERNFDVDEFAHHINILQRHVMARLARRTHPEIFRVKDDNDAAIA